jgi:hypothetical protein
MIMDTEKKTFGLMRRREGSINDVPTRNNLDKRSHVGAHLLQLEYRVIAHASNEEAKKFEHDEFWLKRHTYVFPT